MSERRLIWPDFIDCKVVVICRTEEIAMDFIKKLDKWSSENKIDGDLRFMTERYNFGWESDKVNFWYQKPAEEFNIKNYKIAYWDKIVEYDREMRIKKMQCEVSDGN